MNCCWLSESTEGGCWKRKHRLLEGQDISIMYTYMDKIFYKCCKTFDNLQCTDAIFTFLLHFCQFCVQPCGRLNVSSLVLALCALCKNITRSILAWIAFFCILYLRLFICVKIYARCCVACIAYDKLDTGIMLMKYVCSYRRLWGVDIRARIG